MPRRPNVPNGKSAPAQPQAASRSPRARKPVAQAGDPAPVSPVGTLDRASSTATLESEPRTRREPTVEEIRQRAFEIYLARGNRYGTPESDWLQAERELRNRG